MNRRRPRTADPEADAARRAARAEAVERRRAAVPAAIGYPEDLPVTARRDDLLAAIREHQVVVVAGETGSGKSTQLPKLCLELGRGVEGMIGHTQPRRVAARTVAERVAEELGVEVGGAVGYAVRFTDRVGDQTLVKVMTDGILLAEIQRDRLLRRYDTLIIDEAHERSLNVDFLLGYLKQLLPRRPDLKVIVTSATIDTARFSHHFGGAPVVEVSGRTHPVEVRYRPFLEDPDDERDQIQAVCDAVEELCDAGPGDILVFLSGEREIHDTADALRRMELRHTEVLPLYARLSAPEQHRIFRPHRGRHVVLATNVAETSITVPGVRYVVDAGTARISRYSKRLKVQRLPIEAVSQASANQRAGRCGRVAPGICIRLYSEEDFTSRPEFTEPEILRTNLASVILQMAALGLGDVASFPFVEPPDRRSIADGVALLEELGALHSDGEDLRSRLTPLGRRLAQLPVDPRLGRMLLEADRLGCVREVTVIAAALSIQDVRERPKAHEQQAAELHRRFVDPDSGSDFVSLLNLWDHLRSLQKELSGNQFRKRCKAEFLNYLRVREWQDLQRQLRQVLGGMGVRAGVEHAHPDAVHQALLVGLLSQVGRRDDDGREFAGARGARFAIAPGSVFTKKPPSWVMVGELVETNRLWGRMAARVQPQWVEHAAEHLVKRTYSEPRWDARRGSVVASERVTLFGLPLVVGRTVNWAKVDPAGARDLFIHHALVEGDWDTHHPFLAANRALVEEVRALEDRARRRDILVDDEVVFSFYDARVGADVTSARHFDTWWKRERQRRPDLLTLTADVLIDPRASDVGHHEFPDHWVQGDLVLPLSYVFEPGSPLDGVTVHVPVALLNRVRPDGFDWQVPGLREDAVAAAIKALPKHVRRAVVPAAEHARSFLATASPADGPLAEVLARHVARTIGAPVPADCIEWDRVPDHLRVTFSIEDDHGTVLARGKDLPALQLRLRGRARLAIAEAVQLERSGLTDWTIGTLPQAVEAERAGNTVAGYPALVDEGDAGVAVRVLTTPAGQARAHWAGVRRLLLLAAPSTRKALTRTLSNDTKLALARTGAGSVDALLDDATRAAVDHLVDRFGGPPWDEERFRALQSFVRDNLVDTVAAVGAEVGRIVLAAAAVEARLGRLTAPAVQASVVDARAQLHRLVRPGFVTATGVHRLPDVLRYVKGIERRLDKVGSEPVKDAQKMRGVQALEREVDALLERLPPGPERAQARRLAWQLEELRVSLFAQVLGTSGPVSEQRIRRELTLLAAGR